MPHSHHRHSWLGPFGRLRGLFLFSPARGGSRRLRCAGAPRRALLATGIAATLFVYGSFVFCCAVGYSLRSGGVHFTVLDNHQGETTPDRGISRKPPPSAAKPKSANPRKATAKGEEIESRESPEYIGKERLCLNPAKVRRMSDTRCFGVDTR